MIRKKVEVQWYSICYTRLVGVKEVQIHDEPSLSTVDWRRSRSQGGKKINIHDNKSDVSRSHTAQTSLLWLESARKCWKFGTRAFDWRARRMYSSVDIIGHFHLVPLQERIVLQMFLLPA